jgi:type II secretory pathway component GspD/PulD (secretin)
MTDFSIFRNKATHSKATLKGASVAGLSLLCLGSSLTPFLPLASAAETPHIPRMMQSSVSLSGKFSDPKGWRKTTVDVDQVSIRTVLRNLAAEGGLNLVLDDSVQGTISVSLLNTSVNEAIDAIATMGNLDVIEQPGHIYVVLSRAVANQKGLNRRVSQMFSLKHANATRVAKLLNKSIFTDPGGTASSGAASSFGVPTTSGGGGAATAQNCKADSRSNSIMVIGTEGQLALVQQALEVLDVARESRTYYLSYANAVDVATQLSSTIFNDGINPIMPSQGGGGGASGGGGGASSGGASGGGGAGGASGEYMPASLMVNNEVIVEGQGVNLLEPGAGLGGLPDVSSGSSGSSSSSSSSSSGSSSGSTTGTSNSITIRGIAKQTSVLSVSPEGPLIVPDTRQNSITILATKYQLEQAEDFLPVLDCKPPQVSIEVSLVEMSESASKEMNSQIAIDTKKFGWGFNNAVNDATNGLVNVLGSSFASQGAGTTFNDSANNADLLKIRINALVQNGKAKSIANPSVVAVHDTEAVIDITDQIRRGVLFTSNSSTTTGSGFAQTQPLLGSAGITLDILPKIGADNTVTMRIRPSVSSVYDTLTVGGSTVQLLRKRDLVAQTVRLQDGKTLVIGGLTDSRDSASTNKIPLLGDLPILGALARASGNSKSKSELIIMITPHILNQAEPTPLHRIINGPAGEVATMAP